MSGDAIEYIRRTHRPCITRSRSEKGCGFQLDGVNPKSVAMVRGGKYQKNHNYKSKLCDRLVFWNGEGLNLAAVELKGGRNVRLSEASKQIQNGLSIAMGILGSRQVEEWLPVLLFSGKMHPQGTKYLLTKSVNFRGKRKNIVKQRCGSNLTALLSG